MSEANVSTPFALSLRDRVAEGDLAWVRENYQSGRLNFLREHISADERAQFARHLSSGDMPWIRNVLSRVDIPGVGLLSPATPLLPPPAGARVADLPPAAPIDAPIYTPPTTPGVAASTIVGGAAGAATAAVTGSTNAVSAVTSDATSSVRETVSESTVKVKKSGRRWLLPLLILALLAALLWWLSHRNDDTKTVTKPTVPGLSTTAKAGSTTAAGTATTAAGATATTVAGATPAAGVSVLDALAAQKNHATLTKALAAAGLTDSLKAGGPYTMFAPTDAAFAQLPAGALDKLLGNKDALTKVLLYHTAQGNLVPGTLKAGPLASLQGQPLTIKLEGANVMVNDVAATPGTGAVYSIDKVLLPPGFSLDTITAAPGATTAPAAATTAAPATTVAAATTVAPAPATTKAPAPAATTAAPAAAGGKVSVYFNTGSSDLTTEAKAQLAELAKKIKASGPKTVVKIVGYADERTIKITNTEISRERAQRAANYLSDTLGASADYKVSVGGAIAGADYDKARRADIEIG